MPDQHVADLRSLLDQLPVRIGDAEALATLVRTSLSFVLGRV